MLADEEIKHQPEEELVLIQVKEDVPLEFNSNVNTGKDLIDLSEIARR
jgi:hypothetical protein